MSNNSASDQPHGMGRDKWLLGLLIGMAANWAYLEFGDPHDLEGALVIGIFFLSLVCLPAFLIIETYAWVRKERGRLWFAEILTACGIAGLTLFFGFSWKYQWDMENLDLEMRQAQNVVNRIGEFQKAQNRLPASLADVGAVVSPRYTWTYHPGVSTFSLVIIPPRKSVTVTFLPAEDKWEVRDTMNSDNPTRLVKLK